MRRQTQLMFRLGMAAFALAALVVTAGVPASAHHAFGAEFVGNTRSLSFKYFCRNTFM